MISMITRPHRARFLRQPVTAAILLVGLAASHPARANFITSTLAASGPRNFAFVGLAANAGAAIPGIDTFGVQLDGSDPGGNVGNFAIISTTSNELNNWNQDPPHYLVHGNVLIDVTSANYGNLFSSQTSNVPNMIVPCSQGEAGACLFGSEVTNASSGGQAKIPSGFSNVGDYLSTNTNSVENAVIAAMSTFNGLTPTQTTGEITGNPTFNLGSTVANVISAPDINTTGTITIIGDNDINQYVIFNLTSNNGGKAMNVSKIVLNGIDPTHVLFNLEDGNLSTSGANNFISGIIFVPKFSAQNDAVGIIGELIAGGNLVNLASGGHIVDPGDPEAPEPANWMMTLSALPGIYYLARRRRSQKQT